jgi:hypothetical protein
MVQYIPEGLGFMKNFNSCGDGFTKLSRSPIEKEYGASFLNLSATKNFSRL